MPAPVIKPGKPGDKQSESKPGKPKDKKAKKDDKKTE